MGTKKIVHIVAFILLVIGGINWLLFGIFDTDLVQNVFGTSPTLAEIVYILIGASAIYLVFTHKSDCKTCTTNTK